MLPGATQEERGRPTERRPSGPGPGNENLTKKREAKGERRRGIGQRRGQDRVGWRRKHGSMGAERGTAAALALFFFSAFFCQPWPTSSFLSCLSSVGGASERPFSAIAQYLILDLDLDLASASRLLARHRHGAICHLPSAIFPSSLLHISPDVLNLRQHKRSTRSTHTHTPTPIHGTHGSQSPSPSSTAAFEPLQYLDNPSLPQCLSPSPQPSMENETPRSCRTTRPDSPSVPRPPPSRLTPYLAESRRSRL